MFENQPKGLYALALANTGERFGYYTMLAVFALFLRPTLVSVSATTRCSLFSHCSSVPITDSMQVGQERSTVISSCSCISFLL